MGAKGGESQDGGTGREHRVQAIAIIHCFYGDLVPQLERELGLQSSNDEGGIVFAM